jgi:peptidoglycan hydrolase CwlO-like protein
MQKQIEELDTQIHEYRTEMQKLLAQRESYQFNLTSIKAKLAEGFLPNHLYQQLTYSNK